MSGRSEAVAIDRTPKTPEEDMDKNKDKVFKILECLLLLIALVLDITVPGFLFGNWPGIFVIFQIAVILTSVFLRIERVKSSLLIIGIASSFLSAAFWIRELYYNIILYYLDLTVIILSFVIIPALLLLCVIADERLNTRRLLIIGLCICLSLLIPFTYYSLFSSLFAFDLCILIPILTSISVLLILYQKLKYYSEFDSLIKKEIAPEEKIKQLTQLTKTGFIKKKKAEKYKEKILADYLNIPYKAKPVNNKKDIAKEFAVIFSLILSVVILITSLSIVVYQTVLKVKERTVDYSEYAETLSPAETPPKKSYDVKRKQPGDNLNIVTIHNEFSDVNITLEYLGEPDERVDRDGCTVLTYRNKYRFYSTISTFSFYFYKYYRYIIITPENLVKTSQINSSIRQLAYKTYYNDGYVTYYIGQYDEIKVDIYNDRVEIRD